MLLLGVFGIVGAMLVAAVACCRAATRRANQKVFALPPSAVVTVPAHREAQLRGGKGCSSDRPSTAAPLPAAAQGRPVALAPAGGTAVAIDPHDAWTPADAGSLMLRRPNHLNEAAPTSG